MCAGTDTGDCEQHGLGLVHCLLCIDFFLHIFFFFQAEDGIRDTSVTGVQTCALPISTTFSRCGEAASSSASSSWRKLLCRSSVVNRARYGDSASRRICARVSTRDRVRSEERRVGKECRLRWAPDSCRREG